ncbi:MAG: FmdB family zinc ribbon protein [Burkholderiales bacterium]|nr:MAG: FmdB family transcriptional regulator [Delftia acidovorans]
MPIYAYQCESCGHQLDVLQKMSDAPLTTCPSCAASSLRKQVTAAGFQLKGSGWYVTDFRNSSSAGKAAEPDKRGDKASDKPAGDTASTAPAPTTATTPAATTPAAPAASPASNSAGTPPST